MRRLVVATVVVVTIIVIASFATLLYMSSRRTAAAEDRWRRHCWVVKIRLQGSADLIDDGDGIAEKTIHETFVVPTNHNLDDTRDCIGDFPRHDCADDACYSAYLRELAERLPQL